jgi:hypothetical protein
MWSLISIEFFVISAIVFGLLGRYIAKQKNRSGAEGFWLGLLFSALGIIIVALLPNREKFSTENRFENQYNDDDMRKSVYSTENKLFFYLIMLATVIICLLVKK